MWRGTVYACRGRSFQLSTLIVSLMYKIKSFTVKKDTNLHIVRLIADVLSKFNGSYGFCGGILGYAWVGEKRGKLRPKG